MEGYFREYDSANPPYQNWSEKAVPLNVEMENEYITEETSSGRGNRSIKYCGVCGDIAKSYHFGGLSCDSCKAFFRRSVQNDNYLHFQCCHQGDCLITLANRKSCQFCRMKRCFGIGMEKSWVMTEDERKAMMKARADKKLSKQLAQTAATTTTIGAAAAMRLSFSSSLSPDGLSSGDDRSSNVGDYEPKIEHMADYLEPLEIKEIESIVTKYLHAYQHVPYRTELRQFDHDRPGVQVMEVRINQSINQSIHRINFKTLL